MFTTRMRGKSMWLPGSLYHGFGKRGQGFSAPRSFRNSFAGNAAVIAAEDLNHGQRIEGILIRNPFAEDLPGSESGSQA
jgi:hypothetical protein